MISLRTLREDDPNKGNQPETYNAAGDVKGTDSGHQCPEFVTSWGREIHQAIEHEPQNPDSAQQPCLNCGQYPCASHADRTSDDR